MLIMLKYSVPEKSVENNMECICVSGISLLSFGK